MISQSNTSTSKERTVLIIETTEYTVAGKWQIILVNKHHGNGVNLRELNLS